MAGGPKGPYQPLVSEEVGGLIPSSLRGRRCCMAMPGTWSQQIAWGLASKQTIKEASKHTTNESKQ